MPLVAAAGAVVIFLVAALAFRNSEGWAYDFAAYDAAARRLLAGEPLYLPGTVDAYRAGNFEGLYLYPPPVALGFTPLALIPADPASVLWFALRVALLALGCAVLPVSRTARLATFAIAAVSFPVLFDLNLGNISVVIFTLAAVGWALGDRAGASVAHAILAMLRIPFVAFAALWIVQRRWRMLVQTALAGLAIVVISVPFIGIEGYREYLTILFGLPDVSAGEHNFSFRSMALGAGLDPAIATAFLVGGVLLGLGAIVFAGLRRDADTAFVVTAVATLLTAPFLHPHYLVILLLPAALLFDRLSRAAIALPLLGWLPGSVMPAAVVVVLGLLLLPAADRGRTTVPRERAQGAA